MPLTNGVIKYSESDINNILLMLSSAWERINSLKIENALRESELRYRALFEKSPDAYMIIQDGIITDCNKSIEELLQYDRSEIVGKKPG